MYFFAFLSPVIRFLFASLISPVLLFKWPYIDWDYPAMPLVVDVIYEFPVGTRLESLAMRHNGNILITALSSPEIFQVDSHWTHRPGRREAMLVHTFANATSCTGITYMGRDVFYVIAGNFSNSFSAVPGSWSVYRVDVRHRHPHAKKPKPAKVSWVADFPDSILLNGITVLNKHKKWLLVSDSGAGVVYRLETKTGKVVKVLEDPLMKPDSPSIGTGVKGIKIKSKKLYFTNTDRNVFACIPIDVNGTSSASATVVARVEDPGDFVFMDDHAVIAQNRLDRLGRVRLTNDTLAGPPDGTQNNLFGPTAVRYGAEKPIFCTTNPHWPYSYISTNGGTAQYLTGNFSHCGTISAVDDTGLFSSKRPVRAGYTSTPSKCG